MALSGTLSWIPTAIQTSLLDLVTGSGITPIGAAGTAFPIIAVTNGTGANQATNYVSDTRTLAAGATEVFDFNGGVVDSFGNLVLFTRFIFLLVKASPNNVSDVLVKCTGATPIATLFVGTPSELGVQPGGCVLWAARTAAAYALVAGVSDVLTITNASTINSCTYDIIAVGS